MLRRIFIGMCSMAAMLPSTSTHAQYYFHSSRYFDSDFVMEVGGTFGLMNALTDLGGNKAIGQPFLIDLNFENSNFSGGFYFTGMYRNIIGIRLEGCFGTAAGADSLYKNTTRSPGRYERNLSFRSPVTDFQLGLEFHPFTLIGRKAREGELPLVSPYIHAGVGYFYFEPKAKLNGRWYSLQPLRTEGQGFSEYPDRKPYSLGQMNFHLGGGIRMELSEWIVARLEIDHRTLYTDYLDDVSQDKDSYIDPSLFYKYLPPTRAVLASQLNFRAPERIVPIPYTPDNPRGDPKDNDAYFTIQLKVGVMLGRRKR